MLVGVNTVPPRHRSCLGQTDRYLLRALRAATNAQQDTRFVVFTHDGNHGAFAEWNRVQLEQEPGAFAAFRSGNPALLRAVASTKPDLLLCPFEAAISNPPVPQVLYALDLLPWEQDSPRRGRHKPPNVKRVHQACTQARGIVVASEYLRRRCLELFEVPLNRIMVAPPGVDEVFEQPVPAMVEPPYLLVADNMFTVELARTLREVLQDHAGEFQQTVVVLGGSPTGPEDWGTQSVHIEQCADAHLASLYQHCEFFLYPALHDGSALRILEALRAGAPIITTKSGAITEFAGTSPIFFNPESKESLLQAIRRTLSEDKAQREPRIRAGRRGTAGRTWEKCAWKILYALKRA